MIFLNLDSSISGKEKGIYSGSIGFYEYSGLIPLGKVPPFALELNKSRLFHDFPQKHSVFMKNLFFRIYGIFKNIGKSIFYIVDFCPHKDIYPSIVRDSQVYGSSGAMRRRGIWRRIRFCENT